MMRWAPLLSTASVFIVLLILPAMLNGYMQHIAIICFYYMVIAASWNLLAGYMGQFSIAQHTFAALGGYATGLLMHHWSWPLWLTMLAAPLVCALFGLVLGVLVLRMRALYLAIATWAFAESLRILVTANFRFTRGDSGLFVPSLFPTLDPLPHYYLFLGLAAMLLFIMLVIVRSPIGAFMRAIRGDELAAQAMGINTTFWKLFVFVITSVIAGIMGAFYAHYIAIMSPITMRFEEFGKIVIMAIFGGLGTFLGPIIGAPVVQILFEVTREFGQWRMAVFALIVIVLMRVERGGVMGLINRLQQSILARKAP